MITSNDIVNQPFTKVFRGYDVQEVDLFLDEVIHTLEEHEQQRDMLLSRIEALLQELERCDAIIAQATKQQEETALPKEAALPEETSAPDEADGPSEAVELKEEKIL